MTYIVLTNENELMITKSDMIYRGDNLSKSVVFLLPSKIGDISTEEITVFLSYIRPDGTPDMVLLERDSVMYNDNYYQFVMPVTCKLSRYPGDVCMWLQFCSGDGYSPSIAKSGECTIRIHNSKNLDDCFSDHQLTALYQIKKQLDNIVDNPPDSDGSDDSGGGDSGDSDDGFIDTSDDGGFKVVEF